MIVGLNLIFALLLLTHIRLLGNSRLGALINTIAIQGFLVGLLPVFSHSLKDIVPQVLIIGISTCLIKGWVLPRILQRAIRETRMHQEVEPLVGYTLSMLLGVLMGVAAWWLGSHLPLPENSTSAILAPISILTMMVGLFLLTARRKALTQVIGFLVLENGIFIFASSLAIEQSMLVELSVLLDVFVGVFAMGIATYNINDQFDTINVHRLKKLRG